MQIKDKVFIVTGAARIGLDVAQALLKQGAQLAVTYTKSKPDLGDGVLYIQADLSKPDDAERVVAETIQRFDHLDGLVHMAANYLPAPFKQMTNESWNESMDVIARGAFLITKEAAKQMKSGRIILFSDWSVQSRPFKDYLPYNVAKSAVEGITKSLAKELAPDILVNCIAPGPILMPPDLSEADNADVIKNTPLQRWGGAGEITKAVLFLIDSDFVTGQIIVVDGGRSIA